MSSAPPNGSKLVVRHLRNSSLAGRQQAFAPSAVVRIGRRAGNEIIYDENGDTLVSNSHAEIRVQGGAVVISDLSSTNGTWVNGQRIAAPTRLGPGDRVTFGQTGPELAVELMSEASVPPMRPTMQQGPAPIPPGPGPSASSPRPPSRASQAIASGAMPGGVPTGKSPPPKSSIGMSTFLGALDNLKSTERRRHRATTFVLLLLMVILAAGAGTAAWMYWPKPTKAEPPFEWAPVYEKVKGSVYQVQAYHMDGDVLGFGTAWSLRPGVLATNAHVAGMIEDAGPGGYLMAVRGRESKLRIVAVHIHPGYKECSQWIADYKPFLPASGSFLDSINTVCDVALLDVHPDDIAKQGPPLTLAKSVRVHERVAFYGYPSVDPLNWDAPSAGSGDGQLTNSLDFAKREVDPPEASVLTHNLMTAPGASGSPIFNTSGEVVALNYAGLKEYAGFKFAIPVRFADELVSDDAKNLARWAKQRDAVFGPIRELWAAGVKDPGKLHGYFAAMLRQKVASDEGKKPDAVGVTAVKSGAVDIADATAQTLAGDLKPGTYLFVFNADRPGPSTKVEVQLDDSWQTLNEEQMEAFENKMRLQYYGFTLLRVKGAPNIGGRVLAGTDIRVRFSKPETGAVKVHYTVYRIEVK